MVYDRRRTFNPSLGRFNQREPLGTRYIDGLDLYQCADSNSVKMVDPFGLDATSQPTSQPIKSCGPDVTNWFANEVNIFTQLAKGAIQIPSDPVNFSMTMSIPNEGEVIAANHLEMLRELGRLADYKKRNFGGGTNSCAGTVTLCGMCVGSNQLGNIMYGITASQLGTVDEARNFGRGDSVEALIGLSPAQNWKKAPCKESAFNVGVGIGPKAAEAPVTGPSLCQMLQSLAAAQTVPVDTGSSGCAPSNQPYNGPQTDKSF